MSGPGDSATAMRVADQVRGRVPEPWDVYGERLVSHEVHLVGSRVEMVRSPLRLEGFGLRVLRPQTDHIGVGFVPGTDLTAEGVGRVVEMAERSARYARFPARSVRLPEASGAPLPEVEAVDEALWSHPIESINDVVGELLSAVDGKPDIQPSFGSIKATLIEVTIANSNGLERKFRRTSVEFEFAIKSQGGPEGAPPGEYWVLRDWAGLPHTNLASEVEQWSHHARQVRGAKPMESGPATVVFPPSVLAEFVPAIVGFRVSGGARVRDMMPQEGAHLGSELVTIWDDGLLARGLATAPCDDEGIPHTRRKLIERGTFVGGLYDVLHAQLYDVAPTGNGERVPPLFGRAPRFYFGPDAGPTNMVVEPGDAGSAAEIAETVGDGLWVQQLGYSFPDPISSHFGGEIRIGYRIRGGKLAEPVRGGTVGGPLLGGDGDPTFLRSVIAVGSEAQTAGSLRTPPVVVRNVSVSGGR